MSKWHQTSIGDFIDFNPSESLPKDKVAKKVPMEKLGVFERKLKGFEYAEFKAGPKFRNGDTLVAKITPCLENGKTAFVDILNEDEVAYGSSEFIVLRENGRSDKKFIYYLARSPLFRDRAISCMEGTSGRKRVNEGALKRQEIFVPELEEQQRIAAVLSALDEKIELNNKINAELEQMAKTLYDYWFVQFDFPNAKGRPYKSSGGKMVYNDVLKREVPKGWHAKSLYEIANFINGLPCQKHRPKNEKDDYLPVIKIREMGEGISANTERVRVDIPEKNKIDDGDILFSWSATLDIKIWTEGKGALNQHIFKVTSDKYPRSFYYFELLNYLAHFKMMAELRKTTMGHITIDHLKTSFISVPSTDLIEELDEKLNPIFSKIISNKKQNQQLAALRDWLLPMLMNGQAKVTGVHSQENDPLSIAAEPKKAHKERAQLNIPNSKKGFAKQVLAGKIISLFKDDPHFTDIKFQKIQFLAEHIIQADLNLNYYYQTAGPYDNVFMHTIYNSLKKSKWYDYKNRKFTALEKQIKIDEYYQGYFGTAIGQLDKLFGLLSNATEATSEIIATIYAVWNNFIIEKKSVSNKELIEAFYGWSQRKQQYTKAQILKGLQWLKENHLEPTGFGKLIKKAKGKK